MVALRAGEPQPVGCYQYCAVPPSARDYPGVDAKREPRDEPVVDGCRKCRRVFRQGGLIATGADRSLRDPALCVACAGEELRRVRRELQESAAAVSRSLEPAPDPEPSGELVRLELHMGPFEQLWLWLLAWCRMFGTRTEPRKDNERAWSGPVATIGEWMVELITRPVRLPESYVQPNGAGGGNVVVDPGTFVVFRQRGARIKPKPLGIVEPWHPSSLDGRRVPELLTFLRSAIEWSGGAAPKELDLGAAQAAFGDWQPLFERMVRLVLAIERMNPAAVPFGKITEQGVIHWGAQPLEPLRILIHPRGLHALPARETDRLGSVWDVSTFISGPAVSVWEDGWCVGVVGPWWRFLSEDTTADVSVGLRTLLEDLDAEES